MIQLSASDQQFKINIKLFNEKWKNKGPNVDEFLKYFNKEWVNSKHYGWYEGAGLGPSTNNSLESTNNVIKAKHTFRERQSIGHFFSKLFQIISDWSTDRFIADIGKENNLGTLKQYYSKPTIDFTLWEQSNLYIEEVKPKIKYFKNENVYLITRFEKELIETYFDLSEAYFDLLECDDTCVDCFRLNDFDTFMNLNLKVKKVKFESKNWIKSECTCKHYFKFFICKHIILIAVKKKLISIDYSYQTIGEKNKRGRKSKAKTCFIRQ